MATNGNPQSAQPVQEVAAILCLDTALSTYQFWTEVFGSYIQPLLQAIWKKNLSPHARPEMRVGAIVYTRSDLQPPITTNVYFSTVEQCMKEMRENPLGFGFGNTNGSPEVGMSLLEGLVAATEMCDILIAEAAKKRIRPPHPNIPTPPKKLRPVCHIIVIGSSPPGGIETPMYNNNPAFDDITLQSLPAELVKREIKVSFVLPTAIQPMIDFFEKMCDAPEVAPFKTRPEHKVLLSGVQGPADQMNVAKRALTNDAENTSDKRSKLGSSPKATARNAPGQLKITPVDPSKLVSSEMPRLPGPTAAAAAQAHVLNLNHSMLGPPNPQMAAMQKDYQRMLRMNTQTQLNGLNNAPTALEKESLANTGVSAVSSSEQIDAANTAANIASALKASQEGRPGPPRASEEAPSTSIPMMSSSSSQSTSREGPPARPQSQPQNPSPQKVLEAERGGHSRSQSHFLPNQQPTLLPAQNIAGPNTSNEQVNAPQVSPQQSVRGTPQHHRMDSVGASAAGPSPMGPPSIPSPPKRPETNPNPSALAPSLVGLAAGTTPAMLAQLKAMAHSNSRLLDTPQTSESQKLWAARMGNQGLINPNAPLNLGASTQAPMPANPENWQGVLSVSASEQTAAPEMHIAVLAKVASNKNPNVYVNSNLMQFMLWPQRLSFGHANYRQYDLHEFGALIKTNAIPLCVFEPNTAVFANSPNPTDVKRNLVAFQVVHKFLSERKVGAAIYFQLPTGPQGTGLFLFTPLKEGTHTIVGAAFLTMPIPQFPPLAGFGSVEVSPFGNINPNPGPGGHPMPQNLGGIAAMNLAGTGAHALQMNLMMQHRLQQRAQQQQAGQQQQQQQQQQIQQGNQPSFNGMGMGGMQSMGLGGSVMGGGNGNVPPQMTPQAQAQNRLLSGGFNAMGGFDPNAGVGAMPMGMGGSNFAQQMQNMQGMGGLGAMNFGNLNGNGMSNPMGGALTADMLRLMAAQAGHGGSGPSNG
ncbi:hypothetical protein FRB94_004794 [Tulasnella sp. JGI-2019a]|nr:hypothetical protein FRB94_004794 [Tulasnella sp. JGI-2019a]KAG9015395.1 hypothetical protein FRB93_013095 [Tulasnella sp. JGI-2019a]